MKQKNVVLFSRQEALVWVALKWKLCEQEDIEVGSLTLFRGPHWLSGLGFTSMVPI